MDTAAELRDVKARLKRLEAALGGSEIYVSTPERAVGAVLRHIAFKMGLPVQDITGPRRHARLFRARCAICWIIDRLECASLTPVGRVLGGRDHTTIMNAIVRGEDMRRLDSGFRALTDETLAFFRKDWI